MRQENKLKFVEIDQRKIGEDQEPYIVAEMSGNHNGKKENALEIIKQAKNCGADAIKIQTYTADTLTINDVKNIGIAANDNVGNTFVKTLKVN